MLFMVIERPRHGDMRRVGERFRQSGRMLPEGVLYHASWLEPSGARCFQLMEAANAESLQEWVRAWDDLVEFEIVRVMTSNDYWSSMSPSRA